MKYGGGSEFTIIVAPSKSVLVYALHRLEYVLGLARFRVFVPKLYIELFNIDLPQLDQTFTKFNLQNKTTLTTKRS